jgi:SWI/SNF-related matrix-associated actin-dependent regulator 1 of chromatin subfamily A
MTTVNFDHLLPEGERLFDYQHVGVAYALVATRYGKGCFVCDEQGLGKTRQAIVAAMARGSRKILVICKASLKGNWEREVRRCAPAWSVQVLGGTNAFETFAQCVIINYDILAAWVDGLIAEKFDTIIVDESHYVKSLGTKSKPVQRTVAALKLAEEARKRQAMILMLTGTPLLNRPVELVTQLEMMGCLRDIAPRPYKGDTLYHWEGSFKFTYCGPTNNGYGVKFDGASNLDRLNMLLRSNCFVRRLRNEVLDMEDTHRIQVPLSLNGALDDYYRIERTFQAKNENSFYLELLTALRIAAGVAKIPAAISWCADFVEENPDKKLVVWAWHVEVQRQLASSLNKAGIKATYFAGAKDVEKAKDEFNEGDVQVLVCSLQAHREGHTLVGNGHDVTDCVFIEQPWHPGAVSQAEDRINRIGQLEPVFAHTLVAQNTVDEDLAELIQKKWKTFRAAADGTIPESEELDIRNEMIRRLMERYPQPKKDEKEGDN